MKLLHCLPRMSRTRCAVLLTDSANAALYQALHRWCGRRRSNDPWLAIRLDAGAFRHTVLYRDAAARYALPRYGRQPGRSRITTRRRAPLAIGRGASSCKLYLIGKIYRIVLTDAAQDSRTACLWQANVNNQAHMASTFAAAFAKLAVLGQDTSKMVDCSEVIPVPAALSGSQAQGTFPAGLTSADVEQACSATPFPTLQTAPGPVTSVAPMCVPAVLPLCSRAPLTALQPPAGPRRPPPQVIVLRVYLTRRLPLRFISLGLG
jgi:hypothetical protein